MIFFYQLDELQNDLEEVKELANNRLQELDKLHLSHREALKDVEKLKMDVSTKTISTTFILWQLKLPPIRKVVYFHSIKNGESIF